MANLISDDEVDRLLAFDVNNQITSEASESSSDYDFCDLFDKKEQEWKKAEEAQKERMKKKEENRLEALSKFFFLSPF